MSPLLPYTHTVGRRRSVTSIASCPACSTLGPKIQPSISANRFNTIVFLTYFLRLSSYCVSSKVEANGTVISYSDARGLIRASAGQCLQDLDSRWYLSNLNNASPARFPPFLDYSNVPHLPEPVSCVSDWTPGRVWAISYEPRVERQHKTPVTRRWVVSKTQQLSRR